MSKFKLVIFSAVTLAGMSLAWVSQRQTQNGLRDQLRSLERQITELDSLKADNERLSNLVAQVNSSRSNDQLKELLRLRGELGGLLARSREMEKLRRENRRLEAAPGVHPDIAGHQWVPFDINSLTFAGYDTPEATIQSALWAYSKGDMKALLHCVAPEECGPDTKKLKTAIEQLQAGTLGMSVNEAVADAMPTLSEFTGMQIVNEQHEELEAPTFKVLMSGQSPDLQQVQMVKIGAEWKLINFPKAFVEGKPPR